MGVYVDQEIEALLDCLGVTTGERVPEGETQGAGSWREASKVVMWMEWRPVSQGMYPLQGTQPLPTLERLRLEPMQALARIAQQ